MISTQEHKKKFVEVLGKRLAYVEMGRGNPIVFLHGNPTSSYLWRNVMPHLKNLGRCIAIDLIGMGDSEKIETSGPDRYTFKEHQQYLHAALTALDVKQNVTLVIHDWGSALGFAWAQQNPASVVGICYMEAIVMPMTWQQWPDAARRVFQGFRSDAGEQMVLENNVFVEKVLPGSVLRDLSKIEMGVYRRPFETPGEDRRPTLTWPRQIPLDGHPEDMVNLVKEYGDWLKNSSLPKLFINADPGAILTGDMREFCRTWPNQQEVTVAGNHFLQEDSPDEIGQAIADWLTNL
jgi:haloalkane dehalogenase